VIRRKLNLQSRIIILISIISIMAIGIFTYIFSKNYNAYEEELFGKESLNTLHTLDSSIQSTIKNADNYSKMLISDLVVQEQMTKGDLTTDFAGQQKVRQKVYSILEFSEAADEIWFIDLCGKTLKIGEYSSQAEDKSLDDYAELRTPYGRAQVKLLTGEGHDTISLVRSYNSITDFSSIGIIGVEISGERFRNTISKTVDLSKEKILILDGENNILFWCDDENSPDDYVKLAAAGDFADGDLLEVVKCDNSEFFMSGIKCSQRDWKIIRFTPLPISVGSKGLLRLNTAIVILIGSIMIVGSSLMARVLFKPSQVMLDAMSTAQDGVPQKITEQSSLKEFELLYDGFNSMVDRISELIDETIERQKRIRQVELNEIQEQMKPHFLYNTLESVEALAMMGDTERVCKLIEALGDFFRKSVSGGKEFLTIEEEIRIAKDYIQIMEIRFGDSFNTEIICDDKCLEYMIPKLTIQPLVENAFQHGIRTKNNHGDVFVNVSQDKDCIHIVVEDSGDGVPEEIVSEIAGGKELVRGKSLGLRGTIERLRLMYGESFRYEIKRKPSRIDLYINIGNLSDNGEV